MARHLSTIAALLIAGVALLWPAPARAQELVRLESFNSPPAFFGCVRRIPPKEQVCRPNGFCDWVDPPQYDECWWEPKGLSGGDRIQTSWECCAPAGQVGFVLQVSDTIDSLKGLRFGSQSVTIHGRGESFPNTPELRTAPLFWDVNDGSATSLVLSANNSDFYSVALSDLRPYAGRIAVFRWLSDWGPRLPGWPLANLYSTASGAPTDGFLLQESSGPMWVVFGDTRYPIADASAVSRIWGPRVFARVANTLPARNIRSIPDDGTLLREENGAITTIAGGARFVVPDMPTLGRLFAEIPATQLANGATRLIPQVPRDGSLLREESGRIWVVYGGAKFHVPDEPTLASLFSGLPVFQLWNGSADLIPQVPIDATLLRELAGTTWVVFGGARFHVPDPVTYSRLYGSREPIQLWDGAPEQIGTIPRDGTVFREESGTVWAIAGQARFAVPNLQTLERVFPRKAAFQIWNGALSSIPNAPIDGTLIREELDGVSIVYGGARFKLPDEYTRTRLYAGRPVVSLWSGALAGLRPIPVDGTLLREEVGITWVIGGGARFRVPDPATFQRFFAGRTPSPLWSGAVDDLPTMPEDGALFRQENGIHFAVFGGARFTIPGEPVLQSFFSGRIPFQLWNGALSSVPVAPRDGVLLREESGAIWVVFGGARFHVPDPATLQRLFAGRTPYSLWNDAPRDIPMVPRDRTLLREENGAIWVIYGGAKFHVPDPVTLQRFFGGVQVFQVWDGALGGISEIPRDGTCLGEEGAADQVFQIAGGCKAPAIPRIEIDPNGGIRTVYPGCPRLWSGALSAIPACS